MFGAAKEVTGSCYSLVTQNEKILIDCGMFQGNKEEIRMNYDDFNACKRTEQCHAARVFNKGEDGGVDGKNTKQVREAYALSLPHCHYYDGFYQVDISANV